MDNTRVKLGEQILKLCEKVNLHMDAMKLLNITFDMSENDIKKYIINPLLNAYKFNNKQSIIGDGIVNLDLCLIHSLFDEDLDKYIILTQIEELNGNFKIPDNWINIGIEQPVYKSMLAKRYKLVISNAEQFIFLEDTKFNDINLLLKHELLIYKDIELYYKTMEYMIIASEKETVSYNNNQLKDIFKTSFDLLIEFVANNFNIDNIGLGAFYKSKVKDLNILLGIQYTDSPYNIVKIHGVTIKNLFRINLLNQIQLYREGIQDIIIGD